MDKKDIKAIVITAVSLFLICVVCTGILAYVNTVTAPIIEENDKKSADEARGMVLPAAESFNEKETDDGLIYYEGTLSGSVEGYVFTTVGKGYGGDVKIMTGINAEGKITGIKILTINETPGLGMNAKKESFLSQFLEQSGNLTVVKNKKPADGEILAMTSATVTTKALTEAVNQALDLFNTVNTRKEG